MSTKLEYVRFIREDVLNFHHELEQCFVVKPGIKDMGLIDSAVHAPFQTFHGEDLYPTIIDKAARPCYANACNHGFVDGNKRTGLHSMFVLLEVNEVRVAYEADEIEEIVIALVDRRLSYEAFVDWLKKHCTFSEN